MWALHHHNFILDTSLITGLFSNVLLIIGIVIYLDIHIKIGIVIYYDIHMASWELFDNTRTKKSFPRSYVRCYRLKLLYNRCSHITNTHYFQHSTFGQLMLQGALWITLQYLLDNVNLVNLNYLVAWIVLGTSLSTIIIIGFCLGIFLWIYLCFITYFLHNLLYNISYTRFDYVFCWRCFRRYQCVL
jgi:hypothetical protein